MLGVLQDRGGQCWVCCKTGEDNAGCVARVVKKMLGVLPHDKTGEDNAGCVAT